MKTREVGQYISDWLDDYCAKSGLEGFIIGISGGIDSALTSTLCALTGRKTIVLSMPIRQSEEEYHRSVGHIAELQNKFKNVVAYEVELTSTFDDLEGKMPFDLNENALAMANTRARLRMTTLYAIGQANKCLVAGTGNKVEDFGVGFFTKYGDGGVDVSPIADLTKTEVFAVAREFGVIEEILTAKPTDGLWEDGRSDEDQIGATYPELEWAMKFDGDSDNLTDRQKEVIDIYTRLHRINLHKIEPIPVCLIPEELK